MKTTKRLMNSAKPCKLNPNERAYAVQILDTHFARRNYDTKYMEVQKSQNYRVKLAYFRLMPTQAKINDALKTLREAGYVVDVETLATGGMRVNSIRFMFKGVTVNSRIKTMPGYGEDGQPKVVLKLSGGKKKIPMRKPFGKVDDDPGMLVEPNRDHKKNNGLPATITAGMLTPLTIVMVQWRDCEPGPMMIYDVDLPTSRHTGRPVKSGEIDFRGMDENGNVQRFTSTQVLSIVAGKGSVRDFIKLQKSKNTIPPRLKSIYERMGNPDYNYMVRVTPERGEHEVSRGDEYVDDISIREFGILESMPSVERMLVMLPGSAPGWYLVHFDNELARRYEVSIAYVSRPHDELEFSSND